MSGEREQPSEGELIFYETPEGAVRVEVLYELETFWMNQKRIAELFVVDVRTVIEHLQDIYASGELAEEATVRKTRRVQIEGSRKVLREFEFYGLDAATFRIRQDKEFESDFEKEIKRIQKRKRKGAEEEDA